MSVSTTLNIPNCPYTELLYLSKGSFGRVYKSQHPLTGDWVAIKMYFKRLDSEQEVKALERLIDMNLNSPNLVRFLDKFPTERGLVAVLEYCDRGDLSGYIREEGESYMQPNLK